jgi:hypothetical protein
MQSGSSILFRYIRLFQNPGCRVPVLLGAVGQHPGVRVADGRKWIAVGIARSTIHDNSEQIERYPNRVLNLSICSELVNRPAKHELGHCITFRGCLTADARTDHSAPGPSARSSAEPLLGPKRQHSAECRTADTFSPPQLESLKRFFDISTSPITLMILSR